MSQNYYVIMTERTYPSFFPKIKPDHIFIGSIGQANRHVKKLNSKARSLLYTKVKVRIIGDDYVEENGLEKFF